MSLKEDDYTDVIIKDYFDYEKWNLNKTYEVKMGHMYDPTKIWIVTKVHEVELFHKSIQRKYHPIYQEMYMPASNIKQNVYCVVWTSGAYYRGLIKKIILTTCGKKKVQVLLIDFGYLACVLPNEVFKMMDKLRCVPCFALRASICHIRPIESNWDASIVNRTYELVSTNSLAVIIKQIDYNNKVLYVMLGLYNEKDNKVMDLGEILVKEKLAQYLCTYKWTIGEYKTKTEMRNELEYLFPTHMMIESGEVPQSLSIYEKLLQFRQPEQLYPFLYDKEK